MSKLEANQVDPATGTTLTLGTSGDTVAIPSGVTIANSGTATGFGGTNTPAFRAKSATGQSISNTTHTQVVFGTEVFDTASAFASNVFTVPSGQGGKYFLYAQVGKGGWGANRFLIKIRKGGSTTIGLGEISNATNYYPVATTSTIAELSAGDTIDVTIYHDNGSTQTINDGDPTMFMGFKIIE